MLIDLHAHILPGLDSVCPDRATAARRLRAARQAGVSVIAAASVYDPTTALPEDYLRRRDAALALLRQTLQPESPRLVPGAEVLWCPGLEALSALESLCFGAGNLLLRIQPGESPLAVAGSIAALRDRLGGAVLLTNAETLAPETAQLLFAKGAQCVLPFPALTQRSERTALQPWFAQGHVAALGSGARDAAHPYRALKRTARRIGAPWETVMRSAAELAGDVCALK